jgi:hypothetical protein
MRQVHPPTADGSEQCRRRSAGEIEACSAVIARRGDDVDEFGAVIAAAECVEQVVVDAPSDIEFDRQRVGRASGVAVSSVGEQSAGTLGDAEDRWLTERCV